MNMYISNLGFHTGDEDLRGLFEQFGNVRSAQVINDRTTGRSRGFGFVVMDSEEEAAEAIKGLTNKEREGRYMSILVAEERYGHPDNSSLYPVSSLKEPMSSFILYTLNRRFKSHCLNKKTHVSFEIEVSSRLYLNSFINSMIINKSF